MTFQRKPVLIDGKGHLVGRLAAVVAKELLNGQRIVVVRAEKLLISGDVSRNRAIWDEWLRKKFLTNPRRGAHHHRSPAAQFYRKVRGMIPYKTPRGMEALKKLQVFEGIPFRFSRKSRATVQSALRVNCLRLDAKYTVLGELATQIGWKFGNVVAELEKKRIAKAQKWRATFKKPTLANKAAAAQALSKDAKAIEINKRLAQYGF